MGSKYLIDLLSKGIRIDGRKFNEFRSIKIQKGTIEKAEGSATVKIGETFVVAGIKLELAEPYTNTPDEGRLKVSAEFAPVAVLAPEMGVSREDLIDLARVVDRVIRESGCIELKKLCLEPGKKVWGVFIDLQILNNDGNLLDACGLASVAALLNARIPKLKNDKIIREELKDSLPITFKPVVITTYKFRENFLADATLEEEEILNIKFAFGIRDDDVVSAIQTYGPIKFEWEDIEKALDLATQKSKELRKLL
jgi:exosome complex component RRP42